MLIKRFNLVVVNIIGIISFIGNVLIYANNNSSLRNNIFKDDIKILAVMVEFQEDDFELTYGNGKFGSIYSKDYGTSIIDPLPHDKKYFESHLDFSVNYYQKVSRGNVNISYDVLPDVITVSKPMREYSPLTGETIEPLANFSKEVWEKVAQQVTGVDFSEYNTFVIFHAGVGKDISTNDLFGEARDLPSLFISKDTYQLFYGNSFEGFLLNDGSKVTNTIILPETESREETSITGDVLIELSINGLLVSSIASRIGLPDLFDTETGKSAIGRFGLMDGQSLFAFSGVFPPEPSAWEKIFLGWEEPKVIEADSNNIELKVREIVKNEDRTIIKIPINSSEYYLVENRNRDANNDGANITYLHEGEIKTISFSDDIDQFNFASIDSLKGVVVNVDEYDWALPGNGILIWHIDEKIINENISSNKINVGGNRGVDLEEADGIQDIGEEFTTIFGNTIIAEGEEFDFWYSSNPSKYYSNVFDENSKPNTNSNSGANSLISISNFSDIGTIMSFDVSFGNASVKVKNHFFDQTDLTSLRTFELNNKLFSVGLENNDLINLNSNEKVSGFSEHGIASVKLNNAIYFVGVTNTNLNVVKFDNGFTEFSVDVDYESSIVPVLFKNNNNIEIFAGSTNGDVHTYLFDTEAGEFSQNVNVENYSNLPIQQIILTGNDKIVATENLVMLNDIEIFNTTDKINLVIVSVNRKGENYCVISTSDEIYYYSFVESKLKLLTQKDSISSISLGNLKGNADNYIIYTSGDMVYAINIDGNIAEKFPFINSLGFNFTSPPLIADIDDDGLSDIIVGDSEGNIFSISGLTGKQITGFPLSIGGDFTDELHLGKASSGVIISAKSKEGDTIIWEVSSNGDIAWVNKLGAETNNAYVNSASDQNFITDYFPKNKTYNWPNPVYNNETYIRTYVSEDSEVEVKIFDLAGDLVDEFNFFAQGGLDSEYLWKTNDIQSGAYLAYIKTKSQSGKSSNKIIKIAIIK